MKIGNKYKGTDSIALVRWKGKYSIRISPSFYGLMGICNDDRRCFGNDYEILEIYSDVNMEKVSGKIYGVAERLEKGENIDLEKLLSD